MRVEGPFHKENKRIIVHESMNCMAREVQYSINVCICQ